MVLQIASFLNISQKGIGQIMLQEKASTGLFFLAGIFYGSAHMGIAAFVAALYGYFVSLHAGLLALFHGITETEVVHGLYSFNAVLCAIVFASWKIENVV